MFGTPKFGFTLLEILIAIAIVAVMAIVVVPNVGRKKPGAERKAFVAKLNALTQLAWQNALAQNRLYRVLFDFKNKIVSVEQETNQKDAQGQPKFEQTRITYLDTQIEWPEHLQIKNFFIEGFDESKRFVGRDTGETWFFVVPDGMTQRVTINIADTVDRLTNGRPRKIGLVLNPFNAQFKTYDTFKK
ncbi:MAG: prepilin-type N-terminal cleavage/methylation domain-containing protein [Candidatus Dependentiae bacterium]